MSFYNGLNAKAMLAEHWAAELACAALKGRVIQEMLKNFKIQLLRLLTT